jgi:hypothetical protein
MFSRQNAWNLFYVTVCNISHRESRRADKTLVKSAKSKTQLCGQRHRSEEDAEMHLQVKEYDRVE